MRRRGLLGLVLLPALAPAQTTRQLSRPVYRCGNQLSDRPCRADAAGSAVPYDQPSPADQQAARQRSEGEAREAERLQAERERLERQPRPGAARLDAPRPPAVPAGAAPTQPARSSQPKPARKPKRRSAARPPQPGSS